MSKQLDRLLGKSTLARDVIAENAAQAQIEADELAVLEAARLEDENATAIDEGLEDDMAKLVKKIANSSPNNLKAAAKAAAEMGADLSNPQSERPIWKLVASMLKAASK